jgi:hypothetical protein
VEICLEGRCSIQLSYGTLMKSKKHNTLLKSECKSNRLINFMQCWGGINFKVIDISLFWDKNSPF